ncbi:MAG: gas vesicle protein [Phycisphaerales bacterium]|jgi:hypothetical protein|nr:gas vesicle protein [Phycisphaerales bacterium]
MSARGPQHAINTSNLADLLERVLDKGVVIAGDIKVKLVDIELLTIQLRLVICSVDKAKEMGMDWWANHPIIKPLEVEPKPLPAIDATIARLEDRIKSLEAELSGRPSLAADRPLAAAAQPVAIPTLSTLPSRPVYPPPSPPAA